MRKMGWAVIHSENIWVARLFRRNATMLTHYAVYLVALLSGTQRPNSYRPFRHFLDTKVFRHVYVRSWYCIREDILYMEYALCSVYGYNGVIVILLQRTITCDVALTFITSKQL